MIQEKLIKSFVKRKGRKISNAKKLIIDNKLPEIEIINKDYSLLLDKIISSNKIINMEIGYGSGEHIIFQAINNPDEIFIGCEPYLNGTAKLVTQIIEKKINNIFIFQNDAIDLLKVIPNNFLNKIYILFPDPWPKTKHHKRRIINDNNLQIFIKKLQVKGRLRLATDHEEYAAWMIAKLIKYEELNWDIKNVRDWHLAPDDWINTKYQLKALAGNINFFLNFYKK
jgi:tRNA (guanine-N7-)-methyltransferase